MNGNLESSIKFTTPRWESRERPRGARQQNDEVAGMIPPEEPPNSSTSSVTTAGDEKHMTPSDESASLLSDSEDGYDEDEDKSGEIIRRGEGDYDEEEGALRLPRKRPPVTASVRTRPLYTEEEERAVIKKFDRKLVLFVACLYLLAFLDRSSMSSFLLFLSFPLYHYHEVYSPRTYPYRMSVFFSLGDISCHISLISSIPSTNLPPPTKKLCYFFFFSEL